MALFDKLKNIFMKNPQLQQKVQKRSLVGAAKTRLTEWIDDSLTRVNADIMSDLLTTVGRCRTLAKNDPIARSYLSMCQKNIIGKARFHSPMPNEKRRE